MMTPSSTERSQRTAFLLHIRKGKGEAYDKSHAEVWPEMLELLKRSGVSEYSIFRRDETLFLVLTTENFEATWKKIEADPINTRWQKHMEPLFEAPPSLRPGERFEMLEEVFYLR